jgi:hypothetical protein
MRLELALALMGLLIAGLIIFNEYEVEEAHPPYDVPVAFIF